MHVDARNVPASSILAIVATLASVALLSFSLRAYTRGRLLRSLGTDDWLLLVATLCAIGVIVLVVVLSVGNQKWPAAADDDRTTSLLLWVVNLLHTLGIGFVKLSVALTMLRLDTRSWHRHTIWVYICFAAFFTVLWFGSALLFAGPITVDWSSTSEPEAVWRLFGFVNSILDLLTIFLVVLLPLPLLRDLELKLLRKITLVVVYMFTVTVIAAASVRTYFLHTRWQNTGTDDPTPLILMCSSIELTLGLTAASLLTLPTFFSSLSHHRPSKTNSTSIDSSPPRYPSHTYASTETVIHHPDATSSRFHDDESNLDFDIETPNRTRTHTMRTRGTHSRNVSDWSQFSGFTYYTTTANSGPTSPRRSRVASMNEMEMRTRTIGVGRAADDANMSANIGIAVTTLHNKPVRDSEAGEDMAELAELARLFADKSKDWGTETCRSRRTSVTAEGYHTSEHMSNNTAAR
ncbi:uncharacterized protein M421DRAFT_208234 [Didymella exigua CBS 183.55]|uniref:Rhodopsin domain-containing protein n=1 Tax=Didymella exigua CBS 183.55 TaxID=1150837 RepID=A0A6A5RGH8_9PLEO|nr:uncharacterized protein M421DRAFT_208234 [Didymella exigua CBS 183.55]KAF1926852.1 hypothetical protein M421DRAFT_208234 [Didymella exigua CBS 183.55]